MLTITVGAQEVFDESTDQFRMEGGVELQLEHPQWIRSLANGGPQAPTLVVLDETLLAQTDTSRSPFHL